MNFLRKILSLFLDDELISLPNNHKSDEYIDLGDGVSWFKDYRESSNPTLSDFFGLEKDNQIKIEAKIGKTGFYQTPEGKKWAVVAHYKDESQKEFTFYCPEWTHDPINEYREGDALKMFVDKNDYSKYEMPIY